ncbi:uncharacterized protein LTR77_004569 [Saxophila tyrrhenica]|uniref:Mediator of RNA polymerase II transcription subunit 5 n=1 Tax=Saxophila tyrrhenica TaxID=1690608 RepID=A0AAV9PHF3_9PEZI|nr:hypothetical protein LTR77_004569 [Saxophila tyrrhenica]
MSYLDTSLPTNVSAQKWKLAIKEALRRRLSGERFSKYIEQLVSRYPTPPAEVAKILLSFRSRDIIGMDDCLIFPYAEALLCAKAVSPTSIFLELLRTSHWAKKPVEADTRPRNGLPDCEERMFNVLTHVYLTESVKFSELEAHGLVYALVIWLQRVSDYEMRMQLEKGALHTVDAFAFGTYEAVASLAIAVFTRAEFASIAKQSWWPKRREAIVEEMQKFDTHVLLWMRSGLAGRLQALTQTSPFIKTDSKGRPIFSDQQVLNSITDLPVQKSRAGLFVWLSACLCARPLTDDLGMLTYLQARYPANFQAMAVDLIVAAFDVLTNALLRKEPNQHVHNIRSFICNKLPHLLVIAPMYLGSAMTVEACISMAFMTITMDVLPPISAGATEMREQLKITRLEFLQACALHGLTTEGTVASILQEPAMSLPRVTKYTKEGLLGQCSNNIGRLEHLIDELDGMLGNAGAISGCIVDTVSALCMGRDSISLKTLCNMLIKKPACLDIILHWIHDQDQTEFTPAYEEFASVLLVVLVAVNRYGLDRSDLGLPDSQSFVANLLQNMAISRNPTEISEEQNKQLGKWIEGLYATDEAGETGGISDEVMRNCPPQAFYQLVPTLFHQTVMARKSGLLDAKTFNGGLELLVEPFLLPSLVGGLSWLINHAWEDGHQDADVLLQILDKLLNPSSSSQETKAMHKAILGIVANRLYKSLQILSQRLPDTKQTGQLMNVLKPHLNQRQTTAANKAEMEDWASSANGGLETRIGTTIRDLVAWVTETGPSPPPKYTHRLFAYGCSLLGVSRVRDALVSELKNQTSQSRGPLALDICSAMICAPLASQSSHRTHSVRESLRVKAVDTHKLLHASASEAESLVGLNRRVEAQLAVSQMPQMMALPVADQGQTDQVMAELGLTDGSLAAPGANAGADGSVTLEQTAGEGFNNADMSAALDQAMNANNNGSGQDIVDLTSGSGTLPNDAQNLFGDMGMDMNQNTQQMMGMDDSNDMDMDGQNAEEDIFAGLDMSLGDDFNFT